MKICSVKLSPPYVHFHFAKIKDDLKGTVSIILSDPLCKMAMPDLQRYPLKDLSDQLSRRYCRFSS